MWCSLVLFGVIIGTVCTADSINTLFLHDLPDVGRAICPPWYSSNNGRCYRYFSTKRSWNNARAYCRSMNSGDLLSIHTYSLKYNVWRHTEQTEDGELWVGAYSGYTWLDGTGIPWGWYLEGEPNSDKENCVEVWASGGSRGTGLNDEECKYEQEFACQADGQ
ncbi:C-type lectin mannose-binding isoform-like [Mercenaria mercenaria]|uniref:C-type lectin mannose-binding isoform-like n=1 Tax=Mercenaria mercenaria TaxID=6596 RepID=UPI00234F3911|nr:C-type lectin mannose-binding isoform-like [Mercenaria mercenaria]